nr:MAG TPA: hypothetical protein [Caudoviricetes sp.]
MLHKYRLQQKCCFERGVPPPLLKSVNNGRLLHLKIFSP